MNTSIPPPILNAENLEFPTNRVLIELFQTAERRASAATSPAELLSDWVAELFPNVEISRPGRFFQIVEQIAMCVLPSHGDCRLSGDQLQNYLDKTWQPRTRKPSRGDIYYFYKKSLFYNNKFTGSDTAILEEFNLTHEILEKLITEASFQWQLEGTPTQAFYCALHTTLKKRKLSNERIGSIYMTIDSHMESFSKPSNAFRKINQIITSKSYSPSSPIVYKVNPAPQRDEILSEASTHYSKKNTDRRDKRKDTTIKKLRTQSHNDRTQIDVLSKALETKNKELEVNVSALQETKATHELLQSQNQLLKKKVAYLSDELAFSQTQQQTIEKIIDEKEELQRIVHELQGELNTVDISLYSESQKENESDQIVIDTKQGKRYSNAVRHLYYKLMAEQIPPDKLCKVIITVLKIMVPSLYVTNIQLPKKSAAKYMRTYELPTISSAHKANLLAQAPLAHLNTDGTTLQQKKINGIAVNGVTIGVSEVTDGSAKSIVNHVESELIQLRETAIALDIPGANSINWSKFVSSTSDGASTQKCFNRLVEAFRKRDGQRFGNELGDLKEMVQNFCGMHLGVNLRKAMIVGLGEEERSNIIDEFVREFCKLLGHVGCPEYGKGARQFPDYLKAKEVEALEKDDHERADAYCKAQKIKLARQVGSRYFVSAFNAVRILYLAPIAVEFLKEQALLKEPNKLERETLEHLEDSERLLHVKVDGLFYYHIYADLVNLVKSNLLDKSVLDMNNHYLELLTALTELSCHPEEILNPSLRVFPSEPRLYEDNKISHRKHPGNSDLYKQLFSVNDTDREFMLRKVKAAAFPMKEKLKAYKCDQLPGGKYWNPDEKTAEILASLRPNNDICESLLGLNDWLTTALTNASQLTKSNLVEMKRNHTIQWLENPTVNRDKVINLAVEKKKSVEQQYHLMQHKQQEERISARATLLEKATEKAERRNAEVEKLSSIQLIDTEEQLELEIQAIEEKQLNQKDCNAEKILLIKDQIKKRRKTLKQKVPIMFSAKKKPKSFQQLKLEYVEWLNAQEPPAKRMRINDDPHQLVGKKVLHIFLVDGKEEEFEGFILNYDAERNEHEIIYNGDREHYCYDLTQDITDGSLKVL